MDLHKKHTPNVKLYQGDFVFTKKTLLRETLILGLFVFVLMFVFYYVTVGRTLLENKEEVRGNLKLFAELSSSVIDGDLHPSFTSAQQKTTSQYKNALKPLKKILDNNPQITYIYTMIQKDGRVYFILDPMPEGSMAATGIPAKSNIMDEYKTPTNAMLEAFKFQKSTVDIKPYDDPWGHFISGFAPIFDSQENFVGIVGVDMNAHQFESLLKPNEQVQFWLILKSFFLAVFVGSGIIALRYASFGACKWLHRKFLL